MLWEILLISNPLTWLVGLVLLGVFLAILENENGWYASLMTVVVAAATLAFTDLNWWAWLQTHVYEVPLWFGAYFFVGAFYFMVRWYFTSYMMAMRAKEYMAAWRGDHKIVGRLDPSQTEQFERDASHNGIYRLQVTRSKALILMWITYWPVSSVWWFISKPVKYAGTWIYHKFGGLAQRISDKHWNRALDE